MKLDLATRPLTPAELEALKVRLRYLRSLKIRSKEAAAQVIGVSPETLLAALQGRRVQAAKRSKLLDVTR